MPFIGKYIMKKSAIKSIRLKAVSKKLKSPFNERNHPKVGFLYAQSVVDSVI